MSGWLDVTWCGTGAWCDIVTWGDIGDNTTDSKIY